MFFRDEQVRECVRRDGVLWLTIEMSTPFAVAECESESASADMINGFYSAYISRLCMRVGEYALCRVCERWERITLAASSEISGGVVRVSRRLTHKRRRETLIDVRETDIFDIATGFMKKR